MFELGDIPIVPMQMDFHLMINEDNEFSYHNRCRIGAEDK